MKMYEDINRDARYRQFHVGRVKLCKFNKIHVNSKVMMCFVMGTAYHDVFVVEGTGGISC